MNAKKAKAIRRMSDDLVDEHFPAYRPARKEYDNESEQREFRRKAYRTAKRSYKNLRRQGGSR